MKFSKDPGSAAVGLIFRNTIWAFPYLAVMGMIWGYLANASSGAVAGVFIATAASVLIGTATCIFSESLDVSNVDTYGEGAADGAPDQLAKAA